MTEHPTQLQRAHRVMPPADAGEGGAITPGEEDAPVRSTRDDKTPIAQPAPRLIPLSLAEEQARQFAQEPRVSGPTPPTPLFRN